jgi:type II secretory pathway component PulC
MSVKDIIRSIKPYYRQPQGQVWLLAIALLGVGIVATVVYQLYDSVDIVLERGTGPKEVALLPSAAKQSTASQLAQAPLFGAAVQSSVTRVNTNLLLFGVFVAGNKGQSKAIIASQGKEPKVYKVNDELADGGRLASVLGDRVQLLRNGQRETLYLDWKTRAGKTAAGEQPGQRVPSALNTPPEDADSDTETNSANVSINNAAAVQTDAPSAQNAQEWQQRIKEIREKYQNQFGNEGNANPSPVTPTPQPGIMPMRGFKGFRGGM